MTNKLNLQTFKLSELINEETDFFPLISDEDEAKISKEDTPRELSILPLRNTVLFPGVIIPITIGRDRSVKLIKDAEQNNKKVELFLRKILQQNYLNQQI